MNDDERGRLYQKRMRRDYRIGFAIFILLVAFAALAGCSVSSQPECITDCTSRAITTERHAGTPDLEYK